MAFIDTVPEDAADGDLAALYQADRDSMGYVANLTRAFSLRPEAFRAWQVLVGAIRGGMDLRRYELVTLSAARVLRSSYCSLAHGRILADRFLSADQTRLAMEDHRSAGLDEVDVAVMDLAGKVAGDATAVTEADIDRLRDLGLDDGDVLDVIMAAAVRCFFSTVLDATGTRADPAFATLPEDLRTALTVGRPIAE